MAITTWMIYARVVRGLSLGLRDLLDPRLRRQT